MQAKTAGEVGANLVRVSSGYLFGELGDQIVGQDRTFGGESSFASQVGESGACLHDAGIVVVSTPRYENGETSRPTRRRACVAVG